MAQQFCKTCDLPITKRDIWGREGKWRHIWHPYYWITPCERAEPCSKPKTRKLKRSKKRVCG